MVTPISKLVTVDRVRGCADWLKAIKAATGAEDGVSPSQHILITLNESGVTDNQNKLKLFLEESTTYSGSLHLPFREALPLGTISSLRQSI